MFILVTGGAGFIGSHVCKALARAGYHPVTYDNLCQGHRSAVQWGPLVEGDISDRSLIESTLREYDIAAVMHFAAFAYVGDSMHRPEIYFHNNVVNSMTLLEAMRTLQVSKIVFSSSCATYGISDALPITEDTPQRPVNPYGESKLMVERALHWYGQAHDLKSVALRYFNASGADPEGEIGEDHVPETHLIPLILEATLGRRAVIEIYGTDYPTADGTAVRDYTHVGDLAEAHVDALRYLLEGRHHDSSIALNVGTGRGYSVRQVIAAVERVTGRRVPSRELARRSGDPAILVADPNRAAQVLGWRASRSDIETIISTAWAWHTRHPQEE
jgi:UDP-arabinose 4-epimerase